MSMTGSSGVGSRKEPRRPWPPPHPISPAGRIAAYATTAAVAVMGTAYTLAAARAAMCVGLCRVNQGLAGIIFLAVAPATAAAFAAARSVSRRPVDPQGDARWRFGLSVIFALGVIAAASRFPDFTCPPGYRMGVKICADARGARIAATSWVWLKDAIVLAGIVIGATLIRARRLIAYTSAAAVAVWLAGTGALLFSTLLRLR